MRQLKDLGLIIAYELHGFRIKAESDLEGQCEQYCKLDNIVLSKNAKQPVNMKSVIDDRVLVIQHLGCPKYSGLTTSHLINGEDLFIRQKIIRLMEFEERTGSQ